MLRKVDKKYRKVVINLAGACSTDKKKTPFFGSLERLQMIWQNQLIKISKERIMKILGDVQKVLLELMIILVKSHDYNETIMLNDLKKQILVKNMC